MVGIGSTWAKSGGVGRSAGLPEIAAQASPHFKSSAQMEMLTPGMLQFKSISSGGVIALCESATSGQAGLCQGELGEARLDMVRPPPPGSA